MVLKQEELISRYLDHAMSPAEEQHFLIKLAASDELRIAFRSHLELMRAVRDDKDELRSVAQVRTRTLAALGLSAAAVTPFIEQELVRSSKPQSEEAALSDIPQASAPQVIPEASTPWYSRFAGLLHSRSMVLGTGLMLGFSGAVVLMNVTGEPGVGSSAGHQNSVISRQMAPAGEQTTAPSVQPQNASASTLTTPAGDQLSSPAKHETISERDGLHTMARPETPLVSNSTRANTTPSLAAKSQPTGHGRPAVVDKSNPGTMSVHRLKITPSNDSEKAR